MARERDDGGKFTEVVTLDSVLSVFEESDIPVLTTKEVAQALDCSQSSAYYKLEQLEEAGRLHKKEVGARAVVYIHLDALTGSSTE